MTNTSRKINLHKTFLKNVKKKLFIYPFIFYLEKIKGRFSPSSVLFDFDLRITSKRKQKYICEKNECIKINLSFVTSPIESYDQIQRLHRFDFQWK